MKLFLFLSIIVGLLIVEANSKIGRYGKKIVTTRKTTTTVATPTITPFNIFETDNNTNETAQLGSTVELPCFVKYPSAVLNVSWWKVNDTELPLTVNAKTVARDKRFQARLVDENTNHWILRIRYSTARDVGTYECRIRGDFEASIFVSLHLRKAKAIINGNLQDGIRWVEVGSTLRLSCYLEDSIESPKYIFWYKENRMINYDLDDGESIRQGRMGSELIIPTVKLSHSGNYSCVPSNADQANLNVKVESKDEYNNLKKWKINISSSQEG